jgi:hypothetical protein
VRQSGRARDRRSAREQRPGHLHGSSQLCISPQLLQRASSQHLLHSADSSRQAISFVTPPQANARLFQTQLASALPLHPAALVLSVHLSWFCMQSVSRRLQSNIQSRTRRGGLVCVGPRRPPVGSAESRGPSPAGPGPSSGGVARAELGSCETQLRAVMLCWIARAAAARSESVFVKDSRFLRAVASRSGKMAYVCRAACIPGGRCNTVGATRWGRIQCQQTSSGSVRHARHVLDGRRLAP